MPKHRSSVYIFLFLLLAVQSLAEDKDKKKSNIPDNEDLDTTKLGPESAITIIEAPDLSQEAPLGDSKEEDDNDITSLMNEKTLSAIEILSSVPGEAWVQKFLSQIESDADYNDDFDDSDVDTEENGEDEKVLSPEEKQG